ncbi:MAG: sugar ABC transporter permease [Candidatus Hydrogenedentes bacterium]|nr:sugar ABC transporter permease [Candidatus Hydrogenedentota bacterium]
MNLLNRLTRAWRKNRSEWLAFIAFVAPGFLLFAVFTYWPIAYSFYLSFTNWNLLDPKPEWHGLGNYIDLPQDPAFWQVTANTFMYAISVVAVAQCCAFPIALLLNRRIKGRAVFRTLAFLPYVTTTAAAALAWVLMLHPQFGPLGSLYATLGVQGPNWLQNSSLALCALMVVGIWKEIGFASLFFLAGLQGLPGDVYEAAAIDGAGPLSRLRHITLPLMTPTAFFLMVTGFIAATKAFDVVAVMTEGGPVYPISSTYVYHLYTVAFRDLSVGYASAFATVFFIATVLVTIVQFRVAQRWVHYEN